MAGGYNNLGPGSGGIKVGVVGGGHDGDPAEDQSSNQKIMNPLLHGSGVNLEHLMMSGLSLSPSQFGQQSFPGALDPGTVIYYLAQEGMNGGIILGMANMLKDGGQGDGIGGSQLGGQNLQKLRQTKLNINSPPKIQETTERGVKVKKAQETGEQHRLELLDGLPIHGALFQMAGFRLPEMPNIPTAKQKGSQMMNSDMLEKMAGQLQSMGGLFQGLMGKGGGGASSNFGNFATNTGAGAYKDTNAYTDIDGNTLFFDKDGKTVNVIVSKANTSNGPGTVGWGNTGNNRMEAIYKKVPPHIEKALRNLTILVQGSEGTGKLSYIPGNIVHPETYMNNAEELFSQVQNLDELMGVMQRLEYDTSLFGQDKLQPIITYANTAWGPAKKSYYPNGYVTVQYSNNAQNAINAFSNVMANSQISSAFASVPAGTKITQKNIVLKLYSETDANVDNAVFTLTPLEELTEENKFKTSITFYEFPKSNTFQESYTSDGKKTVYTLKNKYVRYSTQVYVGTGNIPNYVGDRKLSVRSVGDDLLLDTDLYEASDEKTIKLLTPQPAGVIITIVGEKKPVKPTANSTPTGTGAGAGGGGAGGSGGGGSGGIGQNIMGQMFGRSSGIMKELMQRLPQQGEKESQKMTQKLNQGMDAQKLLEVAKRTINGGDPLSKDLFS